MTLTVCHVIFWCLFCFLLFPTTQAFRFFAYLKHDLMLEALKVAEEVIFFDADVLLFRNPWIETTYGRDENGKFVLCCAGS